MDAEEFNHEYRVTTEDEWLRVVNTVFRLAAQTPTLRSALSSTTKAAAEQMLKTDLARAKHTMEMRMARLPPATPFSQAKSSSSTNGTGADPTRQEQVAEIKQAHAARVRAAERRHNLRLRVQASRTAPIGRDGAGRVYWHFPTWATTSAAISAGTGDNDLDYFIVTPAVDPVSTKDDDDDKMDVDVESVEPPTDNISGSGGPTYLQCLPLTRDNLQILIAWLRFEQQQASPTAIEPGALAELRRLQDYAKKLLAMAE
ncbi:hypothetical protein D0Z00_002859 [Geotrichum galactomycetum]|uniref:Uncharacterized protein n=1 Tax=Geotrichum galactomycetum TaxID=27317 RepID=A0ACB6V2V0_9ASCO|nr:hypothetical protein D0Z00_002859 [Geotrichum candidum]